MNKPSFFHIIVATGFGSGFSPVAPGTAGALLATVIWGIFMFFFPYNMVWLLTAVLILVFTIGGIGAANHLEKFWGKDPSRVVVDEMVGVWIALLAVPEGGGVGYPLAAFVLFRLFDIFKPLGIRSMENFKGGVGVMMDDILAGVYSFILLAGFKWLIG